MCRAGEMKCLKLECPTYFGVDVLDPGCIEWETVPPNFQPSAPNCCPEQIRCKNNGSCLHEDKLYKNWEQLPLNVTGCEKRCYCEMGNVECQPTCPPVTALPPPNLACSSREASLQHIPDDDCCMYWVCPDPKNQATTGRPDTDKTRQNQTRTNNNIPKPNKNIFADKTPNKILGPLSVYANQENSSVNVIDQHENPFYKFREKPKFPPVNKNQVPVRPHQPIGPIIPNQNNLPVPPRQMEVNDPDLLHFLQEHPEISNLPHGSVVEIHSLPQDHPKNPFINVNDVISPLQTTPISHNHPHAVPTDISLEEILEELHKNINPYRQNSLPPSYTHSHPHSGPDLDTSGSKHTNKTTKVRPQETFNNHYPDDYGLNQPHDDITVHSLEAVDPHTIRLAFMVPPVIVGLHGRVEVRYTHKDNDDVSSWELQVFAPPNDLIATPSLEFDLLDLLPDKEYKIKITITLRQVSSIFIR
ncbi:putative epidermal cell surface receptor [Sitophilus oryzae]|uniref:Epidermal cell surface receptor n=1 Tax=Sitophilus oryzae TaxID=7048 RepID=A0A6J2XFA1_SITOR|nr:putative epidermal cell surface receptor [Sitophilus oryzae]